MTDRARHLNNETDPQPEVTTAIESTKKTSVGSTPKQETSRLSTKEGRAFPLHYITTNAM